MGTGAPRPGLGRDDENHHPSPNKLGKADVENMSELSGAKYPENEPGRAPAVRPGRRCPIELPGPGTLLAHEGDELFEEIGRIVRSRPRFRVILDREERQVAMAEALQTSIIQIDMGQLDL
jgi:hypothetical protein